MEVNEYCSFFGNMSIQEPYDERSNHERHLLLFPLVILFLYLILVRLLLFVLLWLEKEKLRE